MKKDKPAQPISRERMIANHLGITVTKYRVLRAYANKIKKEAQIGICKDLWARGYEPNQIAQVMEITETTVRTNLKK